MLKKSISLLLAITRIRFLFARGFESLLCLSSLAKVDLASLKGLL